MPENSDSDSDGIPSRHESSAVIMLEPKPVLDNNLLDDLEETWFDDAGNAHVYVAQSISNGSFADPFAAQVIL